VLANLGRREKREEFFAGQVPRNAQVVQFLADAPERPEFKELASLDQRLRGLQDAERTRAERRQDLAAHRLELRHFEGHLQQDELPDLERLPLLGRSADRILAYSPRASWSWPTSARGRCGASGTTSGTGPRGPWTPATPGRAPAAAGVLP